MTRIMPKNPPKINKKRIAALERRITRKDLAENLGISESTLYRYSKGKVKKPKFDINKKLDALWEEFKTKKPTTDTKLKRKRVEQYQGFTFYGTKHFKKMNSTDFIYQISNFDEAVIQDTIDHIVNTHDNIQVIQCKLVGLDENGKMRKFSTPLFRFFAIDDFMESINVLLAKPSKTLKSMVHLEIIGKVYN